MYLKGSRIKLQQQAATVFINHIIDDQQFVALVTFSSDAQILSPLTLINGQASRDNLTSKLPKIAGGSTYICKGLRKGFEVSQTIPPIEFLTTFTIVAFGRCAHTE